MTPSEYTAQRRRIQALWRRWAWLLRDWDIAHRYFEGAYGMVNGQSSKGNLAEARAQWAYLNGSVRWDLTTIAQIDDEELEETIVHEMVHFLLNEMNPDSGDDAEDKGDLTAHEEHATTTISRLLIKAIRKARA